VDAGDGWPAPPATPGSEAVAYQIDSAHTGNQPNDSLRLPLAVRWAHDFGTTKLAYPLVALGLVFEVANNNLLYALDEDSGNLAWGPISLGGRVGIASAAYERGRIFTLSDEGRVSAFDARTGAAIWSIALLDEFFFSAPLTAFERRVYAAGSESGGTLYCVDGANGEQKWNVAIGSGDESAPAVSELGVFVSYAGNQAYRVGLDGKILWHYAKGGSGGGGTTVTLLDSRVYTRDAEGNLVLDALTGSLLGTYGAGPIPAGNATTLFTVNDGVLSAFLAGSSTPIWTFGDGSLTSAPIVVGPQVVVGLQSGELDVVDAGTGQLVSSAMLPAPFALPVETSSATVTGFAAANNRLFLPNGTSLVAY
jgi:outer membrane protein assembly factor BamB